MQARFCTQHGLLQLKPQPRWSEYSMAEEEGLGLEYIMLISIFSCLFAYPLIKMVPLVVKAWIAFYRFMVRATHGTAAHINMLRTAYVPRAHPPIAIIRAPFRVTVSSATCTSAG